MKKVISLFCVLALTLSANAMPTVKKAAQLKPIHRAVMVDNIVTSPVSFTAVNQETTAGEYRIYFYDKNDHPIARADINTGDNNVITGVYSIKSSSILEYNGHYYEVKSGNISMISRGRSVTNGEDIYDVVASGWELTFNGQAYTFGFSGKVSGIAAWNTYITNCNQNGQDCDKARIELTDPKSNATEITCLSDAVKIASFDNIKDEQGNVYPFWSIAATGFNYDTKTYYRLEAIIAGNYDNIVGSYTKGDLALYEGGIAAWVSTTNNIEDDNSWTENALSNLYGTVTKESNTTYRLDFYAVDKSNKVYHFFIYYGNTTTTEMYYDSNNDFHASFSLDQMTPLNTVKNEFAYQGIDNGLNYFIVEVTNTNQYAELLFFHRDIDPEIVIPAGKYGVSSNNISGILQAGEVLENEGNAFSNPSFAADMTNNKLTNYRFIIDGSAEVKNSNGNLYIEVKGVNSFYRIVEITIGEAPVTGIETINAAEVEDGKKLMIDGQLYIKRGDNLYNAQGAIVR